MNNVRQLVSFDHPILAHLAQKLVHYQKTHTVTRWVVAYSGGVDSSVLLHSVQQLSAQLCESVPVVALHINHQLSEQASLWQSHCQRVAQGLGVDCEVVVVKVNRAGKGLEAAAREARFGVFEEYLQAGDGLLLGHHQDDQAETLLLRLFRGAGVKGLSAIPETRAIAKARLYRPLLTINKQMLTHYAQQYQLTWVDDDSNASDDFDRNFLRHRVFPSLSERWPVLATQLSKVAERMQGTHQLLNEVAKEDLHRVDAQVARYGHSVDIKNLASLSLARRNNVLRFWCESLQYALPESAHLAQVETQFFSANALLSSACVSWSNIEMRQFAGRLYLMPQLVELMDNNPAIAWDGQSDLALANTGLSLVLVSDQSQSKSVRLPKQRCHIRWRQGGERCTPTDRQHSQTVKKLLQEYALETWLRDRVPLIYSGDELVAVGDLWVNKGYEVSGSEDAVSICWKGGISD